MKNNTTELVFILDRSGSMYGLTKDTIGGFNSMLAKQKKENGRAYVTTVLFNNETEMLHDRIDIENVAEMTENDYCARGTTALYDAVGETIKHIISIHKYARPEDVPEHTIFIITTDGMENASRRYNAETVRKMVKHEQEKYGWEFIFLGANIDAASAAADFGIDKERAVDYMPDAKGMDVLFDAVDAAVSDVRNTRPLCSSGWREKADMDFRSRRRK